MNKNMQLLELLGIEDVKARKETILSYYDKFTEYIDDWKQQQEARANNKRIMEDVKKINIIIKEMEEVEKTLKEKGIKAELRYGEGKLWIAHNGSFFSRKIKFE